MVENIKLGLNIALIVFVALGILFGLMRGLRKTASRGIFLIITAIITLFITVPITNSILNIQANVNITIEGETIQGTYTIAEALTLAMENFLGKEFATNNPELVGIVTAIPLMIINSIVYLLLFWVLKYLLLPINYLFYKLTLAPRKKKEALSFNAFNDNDSNDEQKSIQQLFQNAENTTAQENQNNTIDNNQDNIVNQNNTINQNNNINQSNLNNNSTPEIPKDTDQFQNLPNENKEGLFIKKDPVAENLEPIFDLDDNKDTENKSNHKEKKEKKPKKQKIKYKKHRLLGGLVGAAVGVFIMTNTLTPIYGILNMLEQANTLKLNNITDNEISLSSATNGLTNDIITAYNDSALKMVTKYTGLESLGLAEFDYLTTKDVGNEKVTLRNDVKALVISAKSVDDLIGKYRNLTNAGNLSSLNKQEIQELLTFMKTTLSKLKEVKFVNAISNYAIPLVSTIMTNQNIKLTNDNNINFMLNDIFTTLSSTKDIDLFNEITAMIDLIQYLNEKNVLIKFLQNDFSNPIQMLNSIDYDFTDKLFSIKTIDATLPHVLNIGLTYIDNAIKFGYVKNEENIKNLQNAVSTFFDRTIEFVQTIDFDSKTKITTNSLIPLGKVMQSAKSSGILNTESYENLINFGKTKLKGIINGIIPQELDDYVQNEVINNMSIIDNWEHEMSLVHNVILKLRDNENGILGEKKLGEPLRQGYKIAIDLKESVFKNIGEIFDTLEETCLFGNHTTQTINSTEYQISGTTKLLNSLLNLINNKINTQNNTDIKKFSEVIKDMQNNIITSNHTFVKNDPYWKNEFTHIAPLIIEIKNKIDTKDFENNTKLSQALDQAKSYTLLSNNATITLMNATLDIVKNKVLPADFVYNPNISEQDTNDKIYKLFEEMNNNLKSEDIKIQIKNKNFWESEFNQVSNLVTEIKNKINTQSFEDNIKLGQILDQTKSHTLLGNDAFFALMNLTMDIVQTKVLPVDFKYNHNSSEQTINDKLYEIFENIKDNLNSQDIKNKINNTNNFWENEFTFINDVFLKLRNNDNGILGDIVPGKDTRQGSNLYIELKESVFQNIGDVLDTLEKTNLLGATIENKGNKISTVTSILSSILDLQINDMNKQTNNDIKKFSSIIKDIQNNILASNHTVTANIPYWKNEFTHISPLIIEIKYKIDTQDFENNTKLGQALDQAKSQMLLGNNATIDLMCTTLDMIKNKILPTDFIYNPNTLEQNMNDKIFDLFEGIKSNLNSDNIKSEMPTDSFWTNEVKYYQNLKSIADKASTIKNINETLKLANDLDSINNSKTIPSTKINKLIAFSMKDLKISTENISKTNEEINQLIDSIIDKLEDEDIFNAIDKTNFWNIELNYIKNLMDIDFNDTNFKNNLVSIGKTLDAVCSGDKNRKSYLIEFKNIRNIFAKGLNEAKTTINTSNSNAINNTLESINTNLIAYTFNENEDKNFWEIELTYLQKLANLKFNKDNLKVIGKTLDDVSNGYEDSNSKYIRQSKLITHNNLRKVLAVSIDEMKDSLTTSLSTDIKNIMLTAIDSIKTNIANTTGIINVSFKDELTSLDSLASLNINSDIFKPAGNNEIALENQQKLTTLGQTIDSIAFKKDTNNKFTTDNSKFITRTILNTLMKDIFGLAKSAKSTTNDQAFNNLIISIQNNIITLNTDDKILSWERELSYVNTLVKLNSNTEYTIDNIAINLGKNIDAIAFNSSENKFNDVEFNSNNVVLPSTNGNSQIITRENLIVTLNTLLSQFKYSSSANDEEIIINEIIDNVTNIATLNNQLINKKFYINTQEALKDLNVLNNDINSLSTKFQGSIQDIKTKIDNGTLDNIDVMLDEFEKKPACGIITTRKIALLILEKISIPTELSSTQTGIYYNKLKTHYEANLDNQSSENYSNTKPLSTESTENPFDTLLSTIPTA